MFSADFSAEFKNYCKARNQQPNDTLFAAWLSCVRDYLVTDRKGRARRNQNQQQQQRQSSSSSSAPQQEHQSSSTRRSSRRRNPASQQQSSSSSQQQPSQPSSRRRSNRRNQQQRQPQSEHLEPIEEKDPNQIPGEGKIDDEAWIPGSPNTRARNAKPRRPGGRKGRRFDKLNKGEVKKINTWNKRMLEFVFVFFIFIFEIMFL